MELTEREKQIMDLILDEKTTQDISNELGISPRTVETHRKNLYLKMDVKTVVGLVKKAHHLSHS